MAATLTMVKSALTRSEFNEVGEETRREETNAVEESIEEAADRMFNPLIYGTSPSVNIPFIPGTSSRRKATGSGGGVFPAFEFQKELSGEHQVFLSSAINPVEFTLQLVSKEGQLERMQDELNDMELSMSSRKIRYNLLQIRFLLFQHFQSLVLSKKGRECVARYLDDGRMYRAKVTEVTNKGVEVELVDYGNIQLCNEQDIRELPQRYRDQPYGFRCCLAGIRAYRAWTDDEITEFCSVDGSFVHQATFLKTVDGVSQIR
jgi:hypothetical protein